MKTTIYSFIVALCFFSFDRSALAGVSDNTIERDRTPETAVEEYCDYLSALSVRQKEICQTDDRFVGQIAKGGFAAWKKCFELFGNDSQVCQFKNKSLGYGAFWLLEASREAAFIYALRSAFYVIHVATLCDYNKTLCQCPHFVGRKLRERGTGRYTWLYVNCINAVPFAAEYVKEWIDADQEPTDPILKQFALYNAARGRELVEKLFFSPDHIKCMCLDTGLADRTCCKGYCIKRIPTEQEVTDILYSEYTGVRRIENKR